MSDAQTSPQSKKNIDAPLKTSISRNTQTSLTILERMLKDINPEIKRELSLHVVRGIRSELSSRAMRREYGRAKRKMGKRGML